MPRLELLAALLLAKLMRTVIDTYTPRCLIKNIYAFSDSTIALHWINSPPHRLQTFIANRVSKIQELLPADHFHHVPGVFNLSDCISRGLLPSQLINHPQWFSGPSWCSEDPKDWPITPFKLDPSVELPETKSVSLASTNAVEDVPLLSQLAARCSSWNKLLRTTVYIYRFLKLLPRNDVIGATDLEFAENKILKFVQSVHFKNEIRLIKTDKKCPKHIQKLHPFISNDLVRVGGRLRNSDLNFDQRHPILLPRKDHTVDLIVNHYHRKFCHAGPNLLFSLLRQRYWIITGRRTVRSQIDRCNFCFRAKPKPTFPLMGDLPYTRTQVVPKA